MKKVIKSFILRGMLGAWGGPASLAIIWAIMYRNGILTDISISQAIQNVWSSMLLAFIAAGISVVHDSQRLPKPTAALIQCAVLYADDLIIDGHRFVSRLFMGTGKFDSNDEMEKSIKSS